MVEALSRHLPGRPSFRLCTLALLLAWFGSGCASTNRDSDLPWNMQQPWETAPSIPGFSPP